MKQICILLLLSMFACKATNRAAKSSSDQEKNFVPEYLPGPHIIVYKTKSDYNKLVPVLLSDDKSAIISYPAEADLKKEGIFQTPTLLHGNFLLDNRGINDNVAFLNLTYEQYQPPYTLQQLYSLIKDKDPLIELYDCGIRHHSTDMKPLLNNLIDNGSLRKTCRRLK